MSEMIKAILRSAKYKNQDTLESRSNIYIYILEPFFFGA